MNEQDITQIEKTLKIRLPISYRQALLGPSLPGDDADHPEFRTDHIHAGSDPMPLT